VTARIDRDLRALFTALADALAGTRRPGGARQAIRAYRGADAEIAWWLDMP
jgi:hypothetical protein